MPYNRLKNTVEMQYKKNNIANNTNFFSHTFIPDASIPYLVIHIPGKKYKEPSQLDYKVEIKTHAWAHTFIQEALYKKVQSSINPIQESLLLNNILMDILNFGPLQNNQYGDFSIILGNDTYNLNEFSTIIYWLIGQEEINYPSPRYLGRNLPIIRYQEAVIGPLFDLSLNELTKRTNNHQNRPANFLENLRISRQDLSPDQERVLNSLF